MRTLVLAGLLLSLTGRIALGDLVTNGASHDASIFSNNPNNSNGAGPGMFAGTDGGPQSLRGLISFDVASAVPAGSTITGVQLTMYLGMVAGTVSGSQAIELHRLLSSWGEGTTESSATTIGGTGQGRRRRGGRRDLDRPVLVLHNSYRMDHARRRFRFHGKCLRDRRHHHQYRVQLALHTCPDV